MLFTNTAFQFWHHSCLLHRVIPKSSIMKHTALLLLIALFSVGLSAQDVTTVEAVSSEISDNLDLEAVASIFADAEDLEDFERKLNDPELRVNNLDINQDGYVDYLRVIELAETNARLITIQAVLGKDLYQDVASIDVQRDDRGQTRVQVVGDVYMYGDNYIVEPVYRYRPVIYTYLWAPRISPWYSSYSWGFYPSYWSHWSPFSVSLYWGHVHHYHGYHNYYYRPYRYSYACGNLYKSNRRNDYGKSHPHKAFASRHDGYANKREYDVKNKPVDRVSYSARAGVTADTRPMSDRGGSTLASVNAKPNGASIRPASKGDVTQRPEDRNTASKEGRVDRNDRPQTATRPSTNTRPQTATRPSTQTRPSAKPNVSTRPQTTTRPQGDSKPSVNARPQTNTRPQASAKPRTSTRPQSSSKPRTSAKPQTNTRPQENRPSTQSRPQSSSRPQRESRPKSSTRSQQSRSKASAPSRSKSSSRSHGSTTRSSSSRKSNAPSRSSTRSSSSSKSKSSSGSRR